MELLLLEELNDCGFDGLFGTDTSGPLPWGSSLAGSEVGETGWDVAGGTGTKEVSVREGESGVEEGSSDGVREEGRVGGRGCSACSESLLS